MRVVDLIHKKKQGEHLSQDEIRFLIQGFSKNEIPDYQMAAFLMAAYLKELSFEETLCFTKEMLHSGKSLDLSDISLPKIDKHSTGGVGDKTSLIVAPIVGSLGIVVPMVSGRSLGHTGGTLDKLEAIAGFNVNLSLKECHENLKKSGVAMMGQTPEMAPADKKMYALRDVTATVENVPLITASIMSKKLAEGTDGIVFDVKFGKGAFMTDFKSAKRLATYLLRVGKAFNKKMVALLTDMNQPLGLKIGNSLEVEESIDVLKGKGPEDLTELSFQLAAYMILLSGKCPSLKASQALVKKVIQNGDALKKWREIIVQQGGDPRVIEDFKFLPQAKFRDSLKSEKSGYIKKLDAKKIGVAASLLGAGRNRVEDAIDPAVGFTLHKKTGDFVERGEALLTLHYNNEKKRELAQHELEGVFLVSSKKKKPTPLIKEVIKHL